MKITLGEIDKKNLSPGNDCDKNKQAWSSGGELPPCYASRFVHSGGPRKNLVISNFIS